MINSTGSFNTLAIPQVDIENFGVDVDLDLWIGDVLVRHTADPHPELGESGGGTQASLMIDFPTTDSEPPNGDSTPDRVLHSPVHKDRYTLSWVYNTTTDDLNVTLTGVHTPEPTSTLSLLSLGILGIGATLKRKLKGTDSIEKELTKVG